MLYNDFIVPDENLFEVLKNNDSYLQESIHAVEKLKLFNIPLNRYSEDTGRPNAYGYKLLNFCKDNGIFIVNGRTGKDSFCGKKNM